MKKAAIGLILALGLASPWPAAACGDAPEKVVEHFHSSLLSIMKEAESLGVKGRYDRLAPDMKQCFDLELMARVASGPHWRQASDDERGELVRAFGQMSIATYASQFDGWSGEEFEYLSQRPGPQDTVLVATHIKSADDAPVGMTYVMRKTDGGWNIADVLLDDDISQLATRRSEYRSILASGGLTGLTRTLEAKAEELLNP